MDWNKLEKKFKQQFSANESQVMIFAWIKHQIQNPNSYTYTAIVPSDKLNVFVASTITYTSMEFVK